MASTGLSRRVDALEQRDPSGAAAWVSIIQHEDQTEEEAFAAYEAEHGPVGESNAILWVVIRKPGIHHATA